MWELTAERRENLVKVCISTFTTVLAGIVIPLVLHPESTNVMISLIGFSTAAGLIGFIYLLER